MRKITITRNDIRKGEAGDCHLCAAALAIDRAFGGRDGHADTMIFEHEYELIVRVHGRVLPVPEELRAFVRAYDDLPRTRNNRVILPPANEMPDELRRCSFELPELDSSEWMEQCSECERPCELTELDDDGCCEDCRESLEFVR